MRTGVQLRELTRLDSSIAQLLASTLDVLPRVPGELFAVANRYTLAHGRLEPGELAARGAQRLDRLSRAFQAISERPPRYLGAEHTLTSTTHANSWNDSAAAAAEISGCADFVGTVIQVSPGRFAMAGSGVAERAPAPRYAQAAYQSIHWLLSANLRLRDTLGKVSPLEAADAICSAEGGALEAHGELTSPSVRRALATLVRQRERKQAFGLLDEARSLVHWERLARGRYVLLDHVDTDLRRYVVCLRVDPLQRAPFALSRLEQAVLERMLLGRRNKTIGGEFGISSPHVTGLAQRALQKLGAPTLAELSRVLHARRSLVFGEWQLGGECLVALGYGEPTADALTSLTSTERQVARGLLDGMSYRQIAIERGVAERTIATQASNIYRKLGVSGRRELMAKLAREPSTP